MSAIDYRRARVELELAAVLDLLHWRPRWRHGTQQRGPCPLHGSRLGGSSPNRVFAVELRRNLYHCFACGAGGNALDLWAAHTRQPLYAAVLDLCRQLGRPVPWLMSKGRSTP